MEDLMFKLTALVMVLELLRDHLEVQIARWRLLDMIAISRRSIYSTDQSESYEPDINSLSAFWKSKWHVLRGWTRPNIIKLMKSNLISPIQQLIPNISFDVISASDHDTIVHILNESLASTDSVGLHLTGLNQIRACVIPVGARRRGCQFMMYVDVVVVLVGKSENGDDDKSKMCVCEKCNDGDVSAREFSVKDDVGVEEGGRVLDSVLSALSQGDDTGILSDTITRISPRRVVFQVWLGRRPILVDLKSIHYHELSTSLFFLTGPQEFIQRHVVVISPSFDSLFKPNTSEEKSQRLSLTEMNLMGLRYYGKLATNVNETDLESRRVHFELGFLVRPWGISRVILSICEEWLAKRPSRKFTMGM
ncbi:hypothetical protein HDU76_011198, partial [Blyttiomyces sp. JEL0837]